MKKSLFVIISISIALFGYSKNNTSDLFLGLKDNKYGVVYYKYNNLQVGLKQSFFTENIREQCLQLNTSYTYYYKKCLFSATFESGRAYSGSFYNSSFNLSVEYYPIKLFSLSSEIQPYYDSGFDYTTCYGFTGKCKIMKEVSLKLTITDIPEFRMPEARLKAGVIFESKNLSIEPEISIPTGNKPRHTRLLCSFIYHIKIK